MAKHQKKLSKTVHWSVNLPPPFWCTPESPEVCSCWGEGQCKSTVILNPVSQIWDQMGISAHKSWTAIYIYIFKKHSIALFVSNNWFVCLHTYIGTYKTHTHEDGNSWSPQRQWAVGSQKVCFVSVDCRLTPCCNTKLSAFKGEAKLQRKN